MTAVHRLLLGLVVTLAALAGPATASGETLLDESLVNDDARDRSCIERPLQAGPGVATRTFTAPATGRLTARLDADAGDWDVAIFQEGTERRAAAAAAFGAVEVAQGVVFAGREYAVQACRRTGDGRNARLVVGLETVEADGSTSSKLQLVSVSTPTRKRVDALVALGLDLVEHHGHGHRLAILHGPDDAEALREAGFRFVVEVEDMGEQSALDRRVESRSAAAAAVDGFPSGRAGTYRHLADYDDEMKALVNRFPGMVKPFTLPHQTYEGRTVQGIELATGVYRADGRPNFLMMGLHHAREWPSGEHAIEWAYELLNGYEAGDARATKLLEGSRTLVVPVINPDGFNASRVAGDVHGHGDGNPDEESDLLVAMLSAPGEYRRKNCRFPVGDGGACTPGLALAENGVDPNRNYGGFWGGAGTSSDPTSLVYHGPAPFSEPETQNVRELFLERPISLHITNHTFSNLWLRPPGVSKQGLAPDEPLYKSIGDAAAAENGYRSIHSYKLYDTTGGTEDWTYWTAGSLGYTPEIGCDEHGETEGDCAVGGFHPPFQKTVDEWTGHSAYAQASKPGGGGGNREAFYLSHEAAMDVATHSVLTGEAPRGARLRLSKTHETPTSREGVTFEDVFEHETVVPASGRVDWHVLPSTRPLVLQERGRPAEGDPSPTFTDEGEAGPGNQPCADYDTNDDTCFDDHPFEVPANGGGVDNAAVAIRMEWGSPLSDWDLKVFRDVNENEISDAGDVLVGSSGQFPTNFEETTLAGDAFAPGKYVARAINYAAVDPYTITATFEGPEDYKPAQTETWTLTCEVGGDVRSSQPVLVARGEVQQVDLRACARNANAPGPGSTPGTSGGGQNTPSGQNGAACAPRSGFRSTGVRPRGARRKLRLGFARRADAPVDIDVFRSSTPRGRIGESRVALFRNRTKGVTWNGRSNTGKKVGNGVYFVRFRTQGVGRRDWRRHTVVRKRGRFFKRRTFYRPDSCGFLSSAKLYRPVFGGRKSLPLRAAFRVSRRATVTVVVRRGGRVVQRVVRRNVAARRTHRLLFRQSGRSWARGRHRVIITARSGKRRASTRLVAQRL